MTKDKDKPLTVSREDLYELAWSKLAIPAPGRGYWARVDAGQQPYRPQLPKREHRRFDDSALTVG
jgi:hypothetical protein